MSKPRAKKPRVWWICDVQRSNERWSIMRYTRAEARDFQRRARKEFDRVEVYKVVEVPS